MFKISISFLCVGKDALGPCQHFRHTHPNKIQSNQKGRYANRIAKGQFSLDGQKIQLPAINNGPNHLHGGLKGFDKYVWNHEIGAESADAQSVTFSRQSPDGEEGYPGTHVASPIYISVSNTNPSRLSKINPAPGTLDVNVTYTLNAANELSITYEAETDKPTTINLTNHAYWNLTGAKAAQPRKVLDHFLTLNCSHVLPVDDVQIPTGEGVRGVCVWGGDGYGG